MTFRFISILLFSILALSNVRGEDTVREISATVSSAEAFKKWKLFTSLDDWITKFRQPDWQLLFKKEDKDCSTAVLLTSDSKLVIATQRLKPVSGSSDRLDVTGNDGKDVIDWKQGDKVLVNTSITTRTETESVTKRGTYLAGYIYPVRAGYDGPIHILKKEKENGASAEITVLDWTLNRPVTE